MKEIEAEKCEDRGCLWLADKNENKKVFLLFRILFFVLVKISELIVDEAFGHGKCLERKE